MNMDKKKELIRAYLDGMNAAEKGYPRYKYPLSWATGHRPKYAKDIIAQWHKGYDAYKARGY